MGLFDALTDGFSIDLFDGEGRTAKRGRRIAREGEQATGRLLGLRVRTYNEGLTTYDWGVEVHPPGGAPFRAAMRQTPPPRARDVVRLGMEVPVRHRDGEVVLAWDGTPPGSWGPKRGVEDGMDDDRLPAMKGEPAEAVVEGWRERPLAGMRTDNPGTLLRTGGGEPVWHGFFVPEVCSHLLAPGTTLPVTARDGGRRVHVDWRAALERHGTGVGVPMPAPTHASAVDVVEEKLEGLRTKLVSRGDPGEGDAPHGVTQELWLSVSSAMVREEVPPAEKEAFAATHGVPEGSWKAGEAAWMARMVRDWRLGVVYGEAMHEAGKRG